MSSTFLFPGSLCGTGERLGPHTLDKHYHWATLKLFWESFHKFEIQFFKIYFREYVWMCMGGCTWRASPEARRVLISWNICGRPGLLWRCYNPNSSPYDCTARTHKSHLSRTEILLWCPKYNHIYKVISTYLATFTKKGLLSYLSYIYFVNLWRKGKMFFTHSVTYPLQARHYVSSQRT